MEQTKALNALAVRIPFLLQTNPHLTKRLPSPSSSSPRAAADLITRATSAPNTFIFAELLSTPQIQALSTSTDYSSTLTLLKIFSYGTYTDYTLTASLPTLSDAQTLKLRQLSFLTLAKNPADLSYANLLEKLGLDNARELEDLVISAIYASLITGTLDPYHQLVTVSSVAPLRDLPPNSIPSMINTLNEWSLRCVGTLGDLEKQIAGIKADALRRHKDEKEWSAHMEKLMEVKEKGDGKEEGSSKSGSLFSALGKRLGGGGKRGGGTFDEGDDEDMEVDEDEDDYGPFGNCKRQSYNVHGFISHRPVKANCTLSTSPRQSQ
ncbi:hypothetical protein B0J14DRAFT_108439 [Halenospora varia]|nr:hypothetical protein B0J14DRAFT_108439 [Halenospora varia]